MESETAPSSANPHLRALYEESESPSPSAGSEFDRRPAAVNTDSAFVLKKELLCERVGPALSDRVENRLVMLNFRLCHEAKGVREVVVENQSNGFRAQIFRMEDQSFKTDYIQLNEGMNRLKLLVVLKDGQKREESLEILSDSNSKQ